jgi:hypothetical protein
MLGGGRNFQPIVHPDLVFQRRQTREQLALRGSRFFVMPEKDTIGLIHCLLDDF